MFESALGFQQGLRVLCIEVVPGIAVLVHDDLGCHRLPSWVSPPDLSDIPHFTKSSARIKRLPRQAARSNGAEIGSPSGDSAQYVLRAYRLLLPHTAGYESTSVPLATAARRRRERQIRSGEDDHRYE